MQTAEAMMGISPGLYGSVPDNSHLLDFYEYIKILSIKQNQRPNPSELSLQRPKTLWVTIGFVPAPVETQFWSRYEPVLVRI